MPKIIESFEEFAARQGCEYLTLPTQASNRTGDPVNKVLFANGAMSNGYTHTEPPADTRTRLTLRREYVKTRLAREEAAFTSYKQYVVDQNYLHKACPMFCPAVPADAPAKLRAGKARIDKLREELAAINEQLTDKAAQQEAQQHHARLWADAVDQQNILADILSVTI